MRLCLAEDHAVASLEPLTLTRPVYELRLGSSTLGAKIGRAFGLPVGSHPPAAVVRPYLVPTQLAQAPETAFNDRDWLSRGPVVVANARWVPPESFVSSEIERPGIGLCQGQPAVAWTGPGQAVALGPGNVADWFDDLAGRLDCVEIGGEWIGRPWDIISRNADHLVRDFGLAVGAGLPVRPANSLTFVGPADRLAIHESARIDPYTVLDTTGGPITVEDGAWIQPFTRLEGPCHIGHGTQLFRANVRGGTTLGPCCRIGGEVEASIVHGYSNKYHEGFLGHAYIGEWVNLGAITSNSDLRNDYGEVSVPLQGDPISTGQAKVGCFLGDHTRTGLGSILDTGTAIGVMCNVLPAGPLLPKYIPSFSAVLYGRIAPGFPLEQMFATARFVMGRRGKEFTALEEQLFLDLYEQTRLERERAYQRAHDRRPTELWTAVAVGS
jgi:UDP-N-acetylglucosamine diphosphorylase/glucosamine-1-phosphate N-acetyltransferase